MRGAGRVGVEEGIRLQDLDRKRIVRLGCFAGVSLESDTDVIQELSQSALLIFSVPFLLFRIPRHKANVSQTS